MRTSLSWVVAALVLFSLLSSAQLVSTQSKPSTASPTPSNFPREYPDDGASVFVENSGWVALSEEPPLGAHVKRGLASSLTYGAVPAALVTEYSGPHAKLRIETPRPVFCICDVPSSPGGPVLVRLHPKKDSRELDGGRIPVLGAKIAEAKESDQVPTEAVQPEKTCWLMRPREGLPVGEYALMLRAQNMGIFAFTIANPPNGNPVRATRKQ
jgi:hypothetical protein